MVTEVQITLEENVAILTDGYFGDMPPPTNWTQFYQTNNIQSTFYSTQNNLLAEYKFSQDIVYKQYERQIYNLLNVITFLGGLFSSLSAIGSGFTAMFSYNLMISSLIRKLYHFKPRFDTEIKKKKIKKKRKSKDTEEEQNKEKKEGHDQDDDPMSLEMNKYTEKLSNMKESEQKIFDSMQNNLGKGKVDFDFKSTNIISMMACFRHFRDRKFLRETSQSTRQVLFFLKGREKLDKEMDIGYVIRQVRILRYFLQTVLDKD